MTTKPDELRELADNLQGLVTMQDTIAAASHLRDYAAALDRAGITDEVCDAAILAGFTALGEPEEYASMTPENFERGRKAMRAALESAALHLHSEKLRALVEKWRRPGAYSAPAMSVCADELAAIIGSKP